MSTTATLHPIPVGPYRLRPVTEQDRPLLQLWIDADPFHAGRVLPDFFLRLQPGEGAWAFEDAMERVVFYLKTQNAARLHIQFGPSRTADDRERNREALLLGVEWLERQLAANLFHEMVFDSVNPALMRHAKRRLAFQDVPGEMRRVIPASDSCRSLVEVLLHQSQPTERRAS